MNETEAIKLFDRINYRYPDADMCRECKWYETPYFAGDQKCNRYPTITIDPSGVCDDFETPI